MRSIAAFCLVAGLFAGCTSEKTTPTEAAPPAGANTSSAGTVGKPSGPTANTSQTGTLEHPQVGGTAVDKTAKPDAPAGEVVFPKHENEPKNLYFETMRDGKTYVVGYVSTLQMISRGQVPPYVVAKPGLSPEGEVVYVETDGAGLEKRLTEDYQKQHPKK